MWIRPNTRAPIWVLGMARWWMAKECQMQSKRAKRCHWSMAHYCKSVKRNCCATYTTGTVRADTVNQVWSRCPLQKSAATTLMHPKGQRSPMQPASTNDNWKIWRNVMVSKMSVSKLLEIATSNDFHSFWILFFCNFAEYVESRSTTLKNDRAAQRRQKVGSSCDFEKTKTASLDMWAHNELIRMWIFRK